ncbi:MAG: hypothetical protein JSW46_04750 [Gemmatimonadota bacterium]|nr:MAG: hypothetical protein JSW46_04750 [Gemmatimonadota bacterium]
MTRYAHAIVLVSALGFALQTPARAQTPEDEVVDVVQRLLDAISDRDSASFRALVMPQLQNLVVFPEDDSVRLAWRETEESIRSLGSPGPKYLERMWEPTVLVSGPIAAVWTPYDFYRDGEFSHCGVDAFHLVRTSQGWRVAAIMYTVVRPQERCTESPLGPPKR